MAFERIEEREAVVSEASLSLEQIPCAPLFLAGKAFLSYRRRQGTKQGVLPDFYIGAHAAVTGFALLALLFTGRGVFYSEHVRYICN
jgi:hypothetical protein